MPLQDLIKKQIDQLGKLLNKILEDLLHPDKEHNTGPNAASQELLAEYGGSLDQLLDQEPDNIVRIWSGKDSPLLENLENLAHIFAALAEKESDPVKRNRYGSKALALYSYITGATATFSFERQAREAQLRSFLEL